MNIITGYTNAIANFSVLLKSKFQTKTDLSTMDAEIISMARICRKLFTVIYVFDISGQSFEMDVRYTTKKLSMQDYNEGSLLLA